LRCGEISASHFLREIYAAVRRCASCLRHPGRLVRQREQLTRSEQAIKTVAACSGLSDQSHLARALQKYLRVTPRAYRESVRARDDRPNEADLGLA
jgi:AraC family transcriptional regulator